MSKFNFFGLVVIIGLMLTSCAKSPESDTAKVEDAKEVQEVATATSFDISKDLSEVTWIGTKPTGQHNGTFGITEGSISVEGGNIVGGKFVINLQEIAVIDLQEDSVSEGKLVGHLQSPDFFDVANHPSAMFEITSVSAYEAAGETSEEESEHKISDPTHTIEGNLTLRGNTLSISFPAKVDMADGSVKAEAKFNIDRTKWGVSYNEESGFEGKAKDGLIYNTVNVGFNITAKAKEAA
ncbi:MAG: YceI family protein [Bacteroidota bacterium]